MHSKEITTLCKVWRLTKVHISTEIELRLIAADVLDNTTLTHTYE